MNNFSDSNPSFEDLVRAVQTLAYGEGEYMNDNSRTSLENIGLNIFQLTEAVKQTAEQQERIANVMETLVELYEWNLSKKNPVAHTAQQSIYQRHPGTDMSTKVQAVLNRIRQQQEQ
jgi:hypothetical protein